jgi:hypothetical protein
MCFPQPKKKDFDPHLGRSPPIELRDQLHHLMDAQILGVGLAVLPAFLAANRGNIRNNLGFKMI